MVTSSIPSSSVGVDSYTDFSSVNSIRALGRADKNQALEKIAQQFESMMVRMMMKSMRSANAVFAEGNMLSSQAGDMYQDMYDDQLALSLSQGRGLGVAEVMVRQLQSRFGDENSDNSNGGLQAYLNNRVSSPVSKIPLLRSAAITDIEENFVDDSMAELSIATGKNDLARRENNPEFDGSIENFVIGIYPMAVVAAKKLGVDPEVIIAQSALETGWGKKVNSHSNGDSSFNLFNIKADSKWDGDTLTVKTMEFEDGIPVSEYASFRSYTRLQQSFDDYVDFLTQSPRYQGAINSTSSENYIRELSSAGYATDPSYADKVMRIFNSTSLHRAVAAIKNTIFSVR